MCALRITGWRGSLTTTELLASQRVEAADIFEFDLSDIKSVTPALRGEVVQSQSGLHPTLAQGVGQSPAPQVRALRRYRVLLDACPWPRACNHV
jgi:hypothetical protein